jgi:hypothetical protein
MSLNRMTFAAGNLLKGTQKRRGKPLTPTCPTAAATKARETWSSIA